MQMGEALLNEERGAWMSSGASKDEEDNATDKTAKDKGEDKKPKAE